MNKSIKKLASGLGLVFTMGLGVVGTLALKENAKAVDATGTMDIYFTRPSGYDGNWDGTVNIYYWGGDEVSWPGIAMEHGYYNAYSEEVLHAAIPDNSKNLIFNANGDQTDDITSNVENNRGFYLTGGSSGHRTYGSWHVSKYTISYNANGGTGTMGSDSAICDINWGLKANTFTRTDYTFVGWNTAADGSGTPYNDEETINSGTFSDGDTLTLYAQWVSTSVDYTYYVSDPRGFLGTHVYGYAFKSSTSTPYHAWPGDALTGSDGIYEFTVPAEYDSIIFNNGYDADPSYGDYNIQTNDIGDARLHGGDYYLCEYYFNNADNTVCGEWASAPEGDYLIKYDGNDYPMGVNTGFADNYHVEFVSGYTFSFTAGDELEFYRDDAQISNSAININGSANAYKEDGHIYVHNSTSEKVYFKNVSALSTYELYIGGYAESYSVANQPLTLDGEFVPDETYSAQYKTASHSWSTGQSIVLRESGRELTLNVESAGDNNLYDDSGTVKVHNACTEIMYVKVRISDGAFVGYLGGRTHTRAIEIGGTQYPLSLYQEPEKPDQYRALDIDVTAGEDVKFIYDGVETSFTPKAVGNNNMTSGKKILASNTVDIYVDLSNNVWISGFGDVGGFHVLAGNRFVRMTLNPENPAEYYSDMVNFYDGEAVKIINCTDGSSLPTVFNPADGIDPSSESEIKACFAVNEGVVTCTDDCSARVYIKISADHDQFYFASASPEVLAAVDYVNNFSSELKDACKEASESAKITAISTAWTKYKGIYTDDLSVAVQGVILEGSSSSVNEIKDFEERYCFFMSEYGTSASLDNFLGFTYSPASHVPSILAGDASSIIMIVTIVSLVGVTAIGGFFYIRKRKSEK